MHRKLAGLLLALGVMLCACSAEKQADGTQQALEFRQKMLAGDCSFQAEITADFDTYAAQFALSCRHRGGEGTDMTITAPETLSGLCAQVDRSGAKIVFADTQASFGPLRGQKVSPMAAPQQMAQAWETGYIAAAGMEDGALRVTYLCGYDEDEVTVDTWFMDGAPIRAEISCDGELTIAMQVTDFTIRKAEIDNERTQADLGGYLAGQSGA